MIDTHGADSALIRGHLRMFPHGDSSSSGLSKESLTLVNSLTERGIWMVHPDAAIEPSSLKDWLNEKEFLLSGIGESGLLDRAPRVVISGSRAAPQAALKTAHNLGCELSALGTQLITGHAAGVDRAAIAGFSSRGGSAVSVHPAGLLHSLVDTPGLHLSPFLPHLGFSGEKALTRNRMMSAMFSVVRSLVLLRC